MPITRFRRKTLKTVKLNEALSDAPVVFEALDVISHMVQHTETVSFTGVKQTLVLWYHPSLLCSTVLAQVCYYCKLKLNFFDLTQKIQEKGKPIS